MSVKCAAIILAGGQSRRMGKPKGLLSFQGKTLIEHLICSLEQKASPILIAGCPETDLYRQIDAKVVDDINVDCGPLGGIYSAVDFLIKKTNSGVKYCLILPCDGISFPPEFVERLLVVMEHANADVVFSQDSQNVQHLYCLLKVDAELQKKLADYLQSGGRKVIEWIEAQTYAVVDFSADDFIFNNLNTPDDWKNFNAE